MIDISEIASGRFSIDMTDDSNWSNRVGRLREILKIAAPKSKDEPNYIFHPYYYCKDGYWYASNWKKNERAVDVFEIDMSKSEAKNAD